MGKDMLLRAFCEYSVSTDKKQDIHTDKKTVNYVYSKGEHIFILSNIFKNFSLVLFKNSRHCFAKI